MSAWMLAWMARDGGIVGCFAEKMKQTLMTETQPVHGTISIIFFPSSVMHALPQTAADSRRREMSVERCTNPHVECPLTVSETRPTSCYRRAGVTHDMPAASCTYLYVHCRR